MKGKYWAIALVAVVAVCLFACSRQAQEPQEPQQDVQQTEPIAEQLGTKTPVTKEDQELSGNELEEISYDELLAVFKQVYEVSKEINKSDSEEAILDELEMIRITVECMEKSLPSDYEAQYRDWRPSVIQQGTQETSTPTDVQQPQQSKPAQGSKPQGNKVSGSSQSQQSQESSSEDRGTTDEPSFREIITDKSQIATGIDDPYSDPTEVSYGGN